MYLLILEEYCHVLVTNNLLLLKCVKLRKFLYYQKYFALRLNDSLSDCNHMVTSRHVSELHWFSVYRIILKINAILTRVFLLTCGYNHSRSQLVILWFNTQRAHLRILDSYACTERHEESWSTEITTPLFCRVIILRSLYQ